MGVISLDRLFDLDLSFGGFVDSLTPPTPTYISKSNEILHLSYVSSAFPFSSLSLDCHNENICGLQQGNTCSNILAESVSLSFTTFIPKLFLLTSAPVSLLLTLWLLQLHSEEY